MTRTRGKGRSKSISEGKHDRAGLKDKSIRCKKGGGGGNFTWGLPGDEVFVPDVKIGDPNYDSQEEDMKAAFANFNPHPDFSYLNHNGAHQFPTPKLNLRDFKVEAVKVIREYFVEGDSNEFLTRIQELDSAMLHHELVKKVLTTAMEKTASERELASKIIVELQMWKLLPANQIAKAYERLFEQMDDLELDIPNVKTLLAQFLAKSVADEVIPPGFLTNPYIESIAEDVVDHAKTLLSVKHGLGRLEKVWGICSTASVEDLKQEVKLILLEYLSSTDAVEAGVLLKRMNVPFFHHEFVKRGVILALERKEREKAMISILFKYLLQNEIISTKQIILGFQRLYQEIDDINLDNPNAKQVLDIFALQAVDDNCMSATDLDTLKIRAQEIATKEKDNLDEMSGMEERPRADSVPH